MSAGAAAQSESARAREKAEELRRRAARLERRAAAFDQGREGEVKVSPTLARLVPAGYGLVDDVRWPGATKANIDHVVFGPTGMYAIDAKNWTGTIAVKDGVLRQNGYRRTRETEKAGAMAHSLQEHLGTSVGTVLGLVTLVYPPDLAPCWTGRTLVAGIDRVAAWIFEQPEIWPAEHIGAIANWLPHVLESATGGPVAVQVATSPRPLVPPPTRSDWVAPRTVPPSTAEPSRGLFGWLRGS